MIEGSYERYEVLTTLDLHLEDGKAILRVMVDDTFDQSFEGFGHGDDELDSERLRQAL